MDQSGIMSAASAQVVPAEHICYVHCNFCNTILAVSVPGNSLLMFKIVTVRCGHCSNLLSVNMGALHQTFPFQSFHHQSYKMGLQERRAECGSHSNYKCTNTAAAASATTTTTTASLLMDQEQLLPMRPAPGKKQRVPSAYNRFIKEEIQRIKANNPEISHREAFSTAAKNWAHIPHMQFGLSLDGSSKQTPKA